MITRTVYSLYYPETKAVVDELWAGRHHEWYERAYEKHQDGMHVAFLEEWKRWSNVDLAAFPNQYATNGASEPIKDLILPPGRLHVFDGEYEGYGHIAVARDMKIVAHERSVDAARDAYGPHDMFWVSNPSAIDGCVWKDFDAFVEEMAARNPHVRIYLDVTYVGATLAPVTLEPSRHPNVAAVIFSLSKPMGVYYHRIGGCFSREPVATLWGNHWFKNLFSVQLGRELVSRFGVTELPTKYAHARKYALDAMIAHGRVPALAQPSDVVLLAHSATGPAEFRRAEGKYRFCLTEGMDKRIKGEW